jgi:hypothetical protein
LRPGLPDVVVHTTEKTRNAHPSYAAAKSGDREAATRLACDLLSNAALESIRRQLGGRRPILVPVRAIEATGINLIPDAMSHEMALRMGLDVTLAIVQTNTVGHTRAGGASTASPSSRRLTGRSRPDVDHVLVDDHVGLGSTLANLRGHIESHGGAVVLATTLSASRRSEVLALRPETLHSLSEKHGELLDEYWREHVGFGIDVLTEAEAEAGYLLRAPSVDAIRTGMARREGAEFQAEYAAIRARIGHAVGTRAGRSSG